MSFLSDYHLKPGKIHDKAKLLKFMQLTYEELFPEKSDFSHLSTTIEQYLSSKTPLWWINYQPENSTISEEVGCLWMGTGVDQVNGDRYGHIFLIYVKPNHRRQGLATTLIEQGQQWVQEQGYHQIGLQVFERNQAARKLYNKLGFSPQSYLMLKSWNINE
ncbi:GNAT family N-acetyltransferase [Crocosphaera chwakensis]|uniref:GCN5-related N-acetyltransferase n=1 Tax=Crocosphaera chwakensis CCY0110 TaxID=391612 RepID=A3IND2_9CHRO|nr:GNAT family N-acetyltransferase [Crocosphaera chwakensis]EAZ92109.1 GCN5-related N-acetyltransferase [Crocosphaera chwakensis CCY0110]